MSGSNSSNQDAALQPLGLEQPVGLTVHSLPPVGLPEQERTRRGRWKLLLLLLVCASPVIASYLTYFVIRPDGRTNYSTLIEPMRTMPDDLGLRALDGSAIEARRFRDQWLLVVLGEGACAQACEDRLFMQRQLREMTGRERERVDKLWIVLDDAPLNPTLREALEATPAMTIARADRARLAAWLQAEAGAALEDHLYIVDPMGQWMMRAPVKAEPAKVKRDLERLLRASAFWDRPR